MLARVRRIVGKPLPNVTHSDRPLLLPPFSRALQTRTSVGGIVIPWVRCLSAPPMIRWPVLNTYPLGPALTFSHGCYDDDAESVPKAGPAILVVSSGSSWGNQVRSRGRLHARSRRAFSGTPGVRYLPRAHILRGCGLRASQGQHQQWLSEAPMNEC